MLILHFSLDFFRFTNKFVSRFRSWNNGAQQQKSPAYIDALPYTRVTTHNCLRIRNACVIRSYTIARISNRKKHSLWRKLPVAGHVTSSFCTRCRCQGRMWRHAVTQTIVRERIAIVVRAKSHPMQINHRGARFPNMGRGFPNLARVNFRFYPLVCKRLLEAFPAQCVTRGFRGGGGWRSEHSPLFRIDVISEWQRAHRRWNSNNRGV